MFDSHATTMKIINKITIFDNLTSKFPNAENASCALALSSLNSEGSREKASSNICTNQTLNAVGSTIHLSWLGPQGLYEIGYQAIQKASYMKQQLLEHNFNISNQNNSLREFILETSRPAEDVILEMGAKGFLAGIKYSENEILVAVTEKRTKNEIDSYIASLQEVVNA